MKEVVEVKLELFLSCHAEKIYEGIFSVENAAESNCKGKKERKLE